MPDPIVERVVKRLYATEPAPFEEPEPRPALDPKSSRARILELEYQLLSVQKQLAQRNEYIRYLENQLAWNNINEDW